MCDHCSKPVPGFSGISELVGMAANLPSKPCFPFILLVSSFNPVIHLTYFSMNRLDQQEQIEHAYLASKHTTGPSMHNTSAYVVSTSYTCLNTKHT